MDTPPRKLGTALGAGDTDEQDPTLLLRLPPSGSLRFRDKEKLASILLLVVKKNFVYLKVLTMKTFSAFKLYQFS